MTKTDKTNNNKRQKELICNNPATFAGSFKVVVLIAADQTLHSFPPVQ